MGRAVWRTSSNPMSRLRLGRMRGFVDQFRGATVAGLHGHCIWHEEQCRTLHCGQWRQRIVREPRWCVLWLGFEVLCVGSSSTSGRREARHAGRASLGSAAACRRAGACRSVGRRLPLVCGKRCAHDVCWCSRARSVHQRRSRHHTLLLLSASVPPGASRLNVVEDGISERTPFEVSADSKVQEAVPEAARERAQ